MLDPGFEPGLPRPQRGVLTTRLIEHRIVYSFDHTMVQIPDLIRTLFVKLHWVCLVLRWGTTRESQMLNESSILNAPAVGIEPTTIGLKGQRSTI